MHGQNHVKFTKVIQKVSTVCAYLSRILETVPLHMCSDFLYQLRSHRRHFVKFVLCLCLFLCVRHVWDNWKGRRLWNRSVIRFLKARNVLPSEIHHQTFQVYGDNAMSDGMVRKWFRLFNEGWENVHDEARSGCPSLVQADDFNKVDHVHRILGQTRCPFGRIFVPRHNNKLCNLLWPTYGSNIHLHHRGDKKQYSGVHDVWMCWFCK